MTIWQDAARRLPEQLLLVCVLAGFTWLIVRFEVDGHPPQPFIFDINDTFMDWFNTAEWAHHPGAFDNWRTVYPPFSFVFLRLFGLPGCYATNGLDARDCDTFGIATILVSYALGALLAFVALRRANPATGALRGVAFGVGLPLLFTLERGNLILVSFVFFALAYGELVKGRWGRALAIAVTINFKPYLLLPALAYAFKRQWRMLELAGLSTAVIYYLSYAVLGEGSPLELVSNTLNWVSFTNGLIWEQIYYSTSYAPFLEFDSYRFPTRDLLGSRLLETISATIPVLLHISQVLTLVSLVAAWLQPRALPTHRIMTILLAGSLVMQSPGGYTEVFLVFLVFLERWERAGPIVAIVSAYLLCVPYDYVFANIIEINGDAWLSGRSVTTAFGVSAGIFIRPGLVMAILWSLALDSLVLVWRAHRTSRPTLSLAPAYG